jgi:hypothetical protein
MYKGLGYRFLIFLKLGSYFVELYRIHQDWWNEIYRMTCSVGKTASVEHKRDTMITTGTAIWNSFTTFDCQITITIRDAVALGSDAVQSFGETTCIRLHDCCRALKHKFLRHTVGVGNVWGTNTVAKEQDKVKKEGKLKKNKNDRKWNE